MSSLFLSLRQRSRVFWGVSILVGLVLLYKVSYLHGIGKLTDAERLVGFFGQALGFGIWSVYLAGAGEVVGPLLMLYWRTAFWGGFLTAVPMAVASFVVYQSGSFPLETLIYFGMSALVMWMMRPGFLRKKPEITKVRA